MCRLGCRIVLVQSSARANVPTDLWIDKRNESNILLK